jgi:phage gp45-like
MAWGDVEHISNKVRNMLRRGYLLKTYNDGKILKGRVKTGDAIENDKLDIVHPVGYVSHVKASEKTEVITADIGGDSSRRVILAVIGDRAAHPKPEEGESIQYAPGDPKKRVSVKKEGGISIDADDQPVEIKTKKKLSQEAESHHFKGTVNIDGDLRISKQAFKPTGPEWASGTVDPTQTPLQAAVLDKLSIGPNGELIVNGDLTVRGNLNVSGTVVAKLFRFATGET